MLHKTATPGSISVHVLLALIDLFLAQRSIFKLKLTNYASSLFTDLWKVCLTHSRLHYWVFLSNLNYQIITPKTKSYKKEEVLYENHRFLHTLHDIHIHIIKAFHRLYVHSYEPISYNIIIPMYASAFCFFLRVCVCVKLLSPWAYVQFVAVLRCLLLALIQALINAFSLHHNVSALASRCSCSHDDVDQRLDHVELG